MKKKIRLRDSIERFNIMLGDKLANSKLFLFLFAWILNSISMYVVYVLLKLLHLHSHSVF